MKNILISSMIVFISMIAFAGNGSGTMSLVESNPEMIYSLGSDGESLNFVRATWINGKWDVKKQSLLDREFDSPVHNAIKESNAIRNWVEVKED